MKTLIISLALSLALISPSFADTVYTDEAPFSYATKGKFTPHYDDLYRVFGLDQG
jgi:hypothetical protein